MEKITITINKKIWIKLSKLKLNKDLRTFDQVLEFLLKFKESNNDELNKESKEYYRKN